MTNETYRRLRRAFLATGEVAPELLRLLRQTVARHIRGGGLPPIYSPTGHWDREAEEEVLADWLAARLIGKGHLALLLQQAATPASFGRLGERNLRQHLINRLERTQAGNLYGRVRALLEGEDGRFYARFPAQRPQDKGWARTDTEPRAWGGSDDELASYAWSLGEFETIVYRDDAKKLSPLLGRDELERFVVGMLDATGCALTLTQLLRALTLRFDLEPASVEPLGQAAEDVAGPASVVDEAHARDLARAAIAELTQRQVDVLRGQLRHETVRDIAHDLRISAGTVSAEQQVISATLCRISDPDGDSRTLLVNALRDALFIEGDS